MFQKEGGVGVIFGDAGSVLNYPKMGGSGRFVSEKKLRTSGDGKSIMFPGQG